MRVMNPDRPGVAVVIDKYLPFIGGAERQAQLLARLVADRIGPCRVFTAQPDAASDAPAVTVHRLGLARPRRLRHLVNFTLGFRQFVRPRPPHSVVHGHALSGLVCGAVLGASLRGTPALVKICSVGPLGDVAKLRRHPVGRWLWPAIRRAAFFVVPTPGVATELAAAGVPAARVTTIPNAVAIPTRPGLTSKAAVRDALGLPDRPTVLFVGRLSPEKGLDVLMRAWDRLARACDATLVIVGAGPESARLRAWLRESGHGDRVRLMGARLDVDRFYDAADVLAAPSHTETFGNVMAEAMAHGLAVVATPVGLAGHWVRHGEEALLVRGEDGREMATALGRVVGDPALRARLGAAARAVAVAAFSADAIADRYVDLYERLTATATRPVLA